MGDKPKLLITCDLQKVTRLANVIRDTILEHTTTNPMLGAEISLALSKVFYEVTRAQQDLDQELKRDDKTIYAA